MPISLFWSHEAEGGRNNQQDLSGTSNEKQSSMKVAGSDVFLHTKPSNMFCLTAERVAPQKTTVLILGETGMGKELIAPAIHNMSPRKDRPLITVNCAALPGNSIESELFGREKGTTARCAGEASPGDPV